MVSLLVWVILTVMSTMTLSEELTWRGFVNQTTLKSISDLDKGPISFYWGVDPSAASMTIGNLAAAMMVRKFLEHGHKAYLLVGGATGLIGDPDGKTSERNLKKVEEIAGYKAAIINEYKTVFDGLQFEIVDNYDWFKNMGYLHFLRDIGKHVPMRQMLSREFVQSRLKEGGAGISYAEFSYALIQGYDYLHLHRQHNVTLQVCGADQWKNSLAGVDLIRRIDGNEAHVWSTPLIINRSTGQKFGKSEDGAIWLNSKLTSVYDFYQFWLNTDDDGAIDYLKIYTALTKDNIETIAKEFETDKAGRLAQKTLAYEVTKLVHGEAAAEKATNDSKKLFGSPDYSQFTADDFEKLGLTLYEAAVGNQMLELLLRSGLASSKTEARHFIDAGAVYLNDEKMDTSKRSVQNEDFINDYFVLRRGKNTQVLFAKK